MAITTLDYRFLFGSFDGPQVSTSTSSWEAPAEGLPELPGGTMPYGASPVTGARTRRRGSGGATPRQSGPVRHWRAPTATTPSSRALPHRTPAALPHHAPPTQAPKPAHVPQAGPSTTPKAAPSAATPKTFPGGETPHNLPGGATPMAWPGATTPKPPPIAATATPRATPGPTTAHAPAPVPRATGRGNPYFTKENADALRATAARLGVNPEHLATAVAYETERTFSPNIWGGLHGNYMGLIQFGPAERKAFGAHPGQSFKEQLPAVEAYLTNEPGVKPGMGLADIYSKILTGAPGRYNWRDINGSVSQHVARMSHGVEARLAREFLASGAPEAPATTTPAAPPSAASPPRLSFAPVFIGDSLAHGLRGSGGAGDTKIGRTPEQVLGVLRGLPEGSLAGRPVVLSSGASNAPGSSALLSEQLSAAKAKGAEPGRITVIGVGPRRDFAGVNERLQGTAKGAGARFQPLLETGRDLVHPKDYGALMRAIAATQAKSQTMPAAKGGGTGAQAGPTTHATVTERPATASRP